MRLFLRGDVVIFFVFLGRVFLVVKAVIRTVASSVAPPK